MKKLFALANDYLRQWSWQMAALLKLCLLSLGLLIGLQLPRRQKNAACAVAGGLFLLTYIPLMADFLSFLFRGREAD